jgi:hypothetical protein
MLTEVFNLVGQTFLSDLFDRQECLSHREELFFSILDQSHEFFRQVDQAWTEA